MLTIGHSLCVLAHRVANPETLFLGLLMSLPFHLFLLSLQGEQLLPLIPRNENGAHTPDTSNLDRTKTSITFPITRLFL